MTFAGFMTRRRPAPSAGPEHHENKPVSPDKNKTDWKGYGMVALAAVLFSISAHFSNAPLKGQHKLLVATSDMPRKDFRKAVVFILAHNKKMSEGLILNMPGKNGAPGYGGPQGRNKVFTLHTTDVMLPDTIVMKDVGLGLDEGKEAADKIAHGKTRPAWYIIVKGYTGWAGGQMENEISNGDWQLVEFDEHTLATTPAAELWDAAQKLPGFVITH